MSRRGFAFLLLLSAAACLVLLPGARAGDVSHARIVRLSYTLGDVQMSADGTAGWHKAIANTPLREGNSLATGDGRAEVEFETGGMAWIASNTVLEFHELVLEDGAKNTQLAVKQGTATFYVNPGKRDSFVVQAGKLTVATRENSRFRVDVFEDGAAVSALHGQVEVAGSGNLQRQIGHQTLALRYDSAGEAVVSGNSKGDGWDRWVSDRYASVAAAQIGATDNLNAPVSYGLADLSYYGGWVSVPGYGIGWQPYGIGPGWSPFYYGYWDSFSLMGGPTWISYEPWGWLPYHYGGWLFSPIYGWVWGPGGFGPWSPATVFWTSSAAGIGWVARAPNETLNGTPINLAHGMVANTTAGMAAGRRNTILRGANIAKAQMTGAWQGEADPTRVSQMAKAQMAVPSLFAAGAKGMQSASRMPQSGAPRIASAGMLAGHVQTYQPPSVRWMSGSNFGASAPAYSRAATPGAGLASGSMGVASSSHASSTNSNAGTAGSGGGGGSHGKP